MKRHFTVWSDTILRKYETHQFQSRQCGQWCRRSFHQPTSLLATFPYKEVVKLSLEKRVFAYLLSFYKNLSAESSTGSITYDPGTNEGKQNNEMSHWMQKFIL